MIIDVRGVQVQLEPGRTAMPVAIDINPGGTGMLPGGFTVTVPPRLPAWIWVVTALGVILLVVVAYVLWRKRKSRFPVSSE